MTPAEQEAYVVAKLSEYVESFVGSPRPGSVAWIRAHVLALAWVEWAAVEVTGPGEVCVSVYPAPPTRVDAEDLARALWETVPVGVAVQCLALRALDEDNCT